MSSSRSRARVHAQALIALGLAAGLLAAGCAHAPRSAPEEEPRAAAEPARPDTPAAAPDPVTSAPDTAVPDRPAPAAAQVPPAAPARLDPTEEITPEELATIPDPVPGSGPPAPPRSGDPVPPQETPPESTEARKGGGTPDGGETRAPAPSEALWSVQIFASEDRKEAESVARRAAAALRSEAFVTPEPPLHKVRVGRFATEEEAQALRDRAVRAGYAGAFRIRIGPRW
jgi:hypothetical protein